MPHASSDSARQTLGLAAKYCRIYKEEKLGYQARPQGVPNFHLLAGVHSRKRPNV